jgi:CRISPR-associated protein Cmr1
MRRTPPIEFAEAPDSPPPIRASHTIAFRIITATYGGGVAAGAPDRITPVRATECRGQLRFWWRASRGAQCATLDEMRAAEGSIWGATDHRSPIEIEIVNAHLGVETPTVRREGQRTVYAEPRYALFPAQSKDSNGRFRPIFKGGSFQVRFRCPAKYVDDLDAALRYWTNFGGICGRTRRGLGAVYCRIYSGVQQFYNPADFPEQISTRPWPQLKGAKLVVGDPIAAVEHTEAWEAAVNLLRDFRQQRNGRMGRSKWPEPDAIRRITGQCAAAHSRPNHTVDEFPRGRFGAPIIFHFRHDGHRNGDPDDTTLLPVKGGAVFERMASPLILKPLAISETRSVPMCMLLNAPQPERFVLREESGYDHAVNAGGRDVLMEFLDFAHKEWRGAYYQL